METVRLGTIGTGQIVRKILDNVSVTDGIELAAVCSRSGEKAQALAAEYGCAGTFTDMDAFLADSQINTVYIATPNLLHFEQTKKALLAGKHVITEKPFTVRLSQARELAELAGKRGLLLIEAAPTAYLPNFSVLAGELSRIGKIRLVMSNYSQYSSRYDAVLRGEKPAVFDPAFGGGCLMDINYYNVLLNVLLFGKPKSAVYHANRCPGLADTSGTMVMEYDGFVSSNAGAKDTWGENFFQIEGERGYIYVAGGANGIASVRTVTKSSDDTYNEQPNPDRLFYEIREVTDLLRREDRQRVYSNLDVTLAVAGVLEAARRQAGILFPGDEPAVRTVETGSV